MNGMIIEGEFFYHQTLRWSLGWSTPNYAGAFIATVLCLTWAARGHWTARAAGLLLEVLGYFLLSKTYSRGAFIAFGAAAFFFLTALGWRKLRTERTLWLLRFGLLATCFIATDFVSRIQPGVLTEDGSVLNRLKLWRAGLEMTTAAPLSGWGAGESGRAFMNWFQDFERTESYVTMVNSYLHVAVEKGLLALGAAVAILVALLSIAWQGAREIRVPGRGWLEANSALTMATAGSILVVWAVANIFTTLWIEPSLWYLPGSAALILVVHPLPTVRRWRAGIIGLAGGLLGLLVLFAAGKWLVRNDSPLITRTGNGVVELRTRGWSALSSPTWHVWPDRTVLGATPGKELRRWLAMQNEDVRLVVHNSNQPLRNLESNNIVILMGAQVERWEELVSVAHQIWLIHPLSPPPRIIGPIPIVMVLLPETDESGVSPSWQVWAKATGAQLRTTPHCGQDLRAAWPAVMNFGYLDRSMNVTLACP